VNYSLGKNIIPIMLTSPSRTAPPLLDTSTIRYPIICTSPCWASRTLARVYAISSARSAETYATDRIVFRTAVMMERYNLTLDSSLLLLPATQKWPLKLNSFRQMLLPQAGSRQSLLLAMTGHTASSLSGLLRLISPVAFSLVVLKAKLLI
jgi:hypothetical protein